VAALTAACIVTLLAIIGLLAFAYMWWLRNTVQ
jgi:hypothetical protein